MPRRPVRHRLTRLVPLLLGTAVLTIAGCGETVPGGAPGRPADVPTRSSESPRVLMAREVAAFDAHAGTTLHAAFAPDGEHLLTTSLDGTAILWSLDGDEVARLEGHRASIHQAVFSEDGSRIATASADHTARLWDPEGRSIGPVLAADTLMRRVDFAPGTDRPVALSLGGTVLTPTGEGGARPIKSATPIEFALPLAEGRLLLVLAEGGAFRGRVDTSVLGTEIILPRGDPIVAAAASPDGSRVVAWSDGSEALLFGATPGRPKPLFGHEAPILAAAVADDGRAITGALDRTARLWGPDGREQAVLRGHGAGVHTVRFAPDEGTLLTVSSDRTVRVWTPEGKARALIEQAAAPIRDAAYSPDGRWILTLPADAGPALVWDLDGHLRWILPDASGRTLEAVCSPTGKHVVTVDRDLTPHLFALDGAPAADELLPPNGSPRDRPARGDYAGTIACAPCHRNAYEGWRRSSHARTSYFPHETDLPSEVLAGERVEHAPGWSRFGGGEEGGWWVETAGADGQPARFPLVMVSGHLRVRFFVTRMEDGRLQVLPAMLELPTGEWFDYTHLIFGAPTGDFETPPVIQPGDPSFWTGPVRSWDARCAHCHMSGRTWREPRPDGTGPRSTWRSFGVDCEACHGPGRRHAEAWRRMEMDAPLPKLESLPLERRTEACTRCHQEGELLDPPFVLGRDLYEVIDPTVVVDPERADPGGRPLELIYDGLPFATSTCANEGGLTCSTCHAPHGSTHRSLLRRPPDSNDFCLPCHRDHVENPRPHTHHDPRGSGGRCITCHMPFVTIERGHGAVADHTIGTPRLGLPGDRVQTDACTWCHEGGLQAPTDAPALVQEELLRSYETWWTGRGWPRDWMAALARGRLREEGALADLERVLETPTLPPEVRASAALLLARYLPESAESVFRFVKDEDSLVRRSAIRALAELEGREADEALRAALQDPSNAVRVAAARTALAGWTRVQQNRGLLEAVVPVLQRDAERVPDDDRRWFRLGAAYDLLGDPARALAAYERQLMLDPFADAVRRHAETLRRNLAEPEED